MISTPIHELSENVYAPIYKYFLSLVMNLNRFLFCNATRLKWFWIVAVPFLVWEMVNYC